ncbi:DUF1492 domain-containing protein [Clostridium botulinum]|uniref:DUF1492 domain-containing protein n=1 Tax=Clostridium botulinum TaxID=1491 RepID=UPI0004D7C3D9|nr:DUF1492 domain-containing protein [Clostridium botulinum]KEH99959.1 hypothetical protein Z952_14650 [Clostridium botulinum C/D str. BKT75002]KEI05681.1 hypothetical protein Z954_14830 [Clostridium botulinum C/D str. BKT2873]MCD3351754.1 sigma-70 family RNA polymerase sigma factor [Clostridium botulinum D/C]MCD3360680.1 sigma-70 family RNA polymerase sigma factor [Clostridium botulinum D/C]MCD3362106.1 sigma-70 family RNA polymerase sigma factor [Clostridium botulinum D/C]
MNYINEAIEYLTSYNDLKIALKNLKNKELLLKENLEEIKSVSLDGMPKSNMIDPDDRIINIIFKLDQTRNYIKETENKIKEIDNIFKNFKENELTKEYGKILRLWYIEQWSKIRIAMEFNCSERQLYRIRSKAIRKLAIQLFGIKVIA